MNEKQNLRYELLKANRYDVNNSKTCYEFIEGNEQPANARLTATNWQTAFI